MFAWGTNDFFQLGKQNNFDDKEDENIAISVSFENGIKPKKVNFFINF